MKIKLLGSLVKLIGYKEKEQEIHHNARIIDVLNQILSNKTKGDPNFLNITVLLDGIEVLTLPHGLKTKVRKDSELILIPISHGG